MKKFLTNLCPLLVLALLFNLNYAAAQGELGTNDDGFVVQIKTPSSIAQTIFYGFEAGVCQWVGQSSNNGAAPWGADVTEELCGQVVWAKDSLACVPGTKDLTGKIALVRRGTCNFSLKVYHAQQRGAKAVIVLNNYANPNDGPCTTTSGTLLFGGMAAGDSAAAVKIPAIFLEQLNAEQIDGALAAGEEVNICFSFPRMISATAASMYATPLSQVGTMGAITATYNNRSGAAQTNVNLKAEFFDPSGNLTGTRNYNMPFVAPGVDSFVVFQPYEAPAAKGVHSVRFTNDKSTESIDTLIVNFEHTDFTFATDNYKVNPNGVGPSDDQFATASFYIQSGGLCLTGPSPGKATYATFGIANIQDVYVPSDPSANVIGIAVYKADVDGDGTGDLSSSFIDDLSAGLLSYVEYEMTGNESNSQLIHVPLIDLNSGDEGIVLDADVAYYVSLIYDGTAAGTGKCVRFLSTGDFPYASFTGYPTTPLYLGQLYTGGWSGATVVQRLQMEGFKPTSVAEPKHLADSKVKITPNPANEFINLEFNLDGVNPSVAVSILDGNARKVTETRVQRDVQNGVMNFNVEQLPSGVYYVWVRTAEGSTMKKVSICH